jgi:primary-amine oxidase
MVDGLNNSVVETDIVTLGDAPTGSAGNFAGNAFVTQDKVLKLQGEGARDYNFGAERRWEITNPARKHYSSGRDVSYSIGMKGAVTRLIAREDSWSVKRAVFGKKALWVIKDVEDSKRRGRMWPVGKYVLQTREEPVDSVGQWVKGEDSIENEDILLYIMITIGTTHIPRPEDWPV